MKINEITGRLDEGDVQYQHVVDKGPKTPEELAAINAQRAASGEQAAVVAAHNAQMASGLYAQPAGSKPATAPTPAAPTPPTSPTPPAVPAQPKQPAQTAPAAGEYVVKSGDTLSKIASQMGTNLQALLKANPQFQANPNLIKPGQKVTPPSGASVPATPTVGASVTATKPSTVPTPVSQPAPTPAAQTPAQPAPKYSVEPAKVGMNGEMAYFVNDIEKGLTVKSFDSQQEADAWIKQQPVNEELDTILSFAGLK